MCTYEIENTIAKEETMNICMENCRKIYNEIEVNKSDIQSCKIIVQMKTRFGDLKHIAFIELLNEKKLVYII